MQFATWVSRTPEIQQSLHLDTAAMGGFTLAMARGSLFGMILGGQIIHRAGVRATLLVSYGLSAVLLASLGISVIQGALGYSTVLVIAFGAACGSGGLAVNVEGASVDRASSRSLLPSLHGAFSVGTLVGAAIGTVMILASIDVLTQFVSLGAVLFVINVIIWRVLPVDEVLSTQNITIAPSSPPSRQERARVWREPRTLKIAIIVLGFNLAEGTASTWLPIAMVDSGLGEAAASGTYSVFAAAMALTRLTGGYFVDSLGRSRALLVFALICASGIVVTIATPLISLPFLGAALWGIGNSLGFPLCVASISDEPRLASSRVGVLALSSNIAGLTGPPLLGGLGQAVGILSAFWIPVGLLAGGMSLNSATQDHRNGKAFH